MFACVGNVAWAEEEYREPSCSPDSSYVLRAPEADFLEKYKKDAAFPWHFYEIMISCSQRILFFRRLLAFGSG